jgi:hypothetical protein
MRTVHYFYKLLKCNKRVARLNKQSVAMEVVITASRTVSLGISQLHVQDVL